jgi:hypothetical protein
MSDPPAKRRRHLLTALFVVLVVVNGVYAHVKAQRAAVVSGLGRPLYLSRYILEEKNRTV